MIRLSPARRPCREAGRVVATLAAAVLFACAAARPTGADDSGAFDGAARELLERIESRGGAGSVRIAVVPFDPYETPIDRRRAASVATMLESALARAAGPMPMVQIKARSGLGRVVSEIWELGFDESYRARAQQVLHRAGEFDVMVMGDIRLDAADGRPRARFQAIGLDEGAVLAATEPVPLETAGPAAHDGMGLAARRTARKLVEDVGDLSVLLTAGIRYRDTAHRPSLGGWFQDLLTREMQKLVRDTLTERNLTVRPLGIDEGWLRGLHGRFLPDWDGALSAYPPLEAGHYVLSGRYWETPEAIRYKVGLWTRAGLVASDFGGFRRDEAAAGIPVRPEGDFGFLTGTDGANAFRFGLTAHEGGRSPVYEVGDKIHLVLHSEIDAWIACYWWGRGEDGRYALTRILPNEEMRDGGWVSGGRAYTVPGLEPTARPDDPWPFNLTADGPPGENLVKCFATDRDVADILPPGLAGRTFARLPDGAAERLSAAFRETGAKVAENSMVVTIVEGG